MPPKPLKFLLIGGRVVSKNDGDVHYVNANRLMQLYGLNMTDHYVVLAEENGNFLKGFNQDEFVVLRPRYDGDYRLPYEKCQRCNGDGIYIHSVELDDNPGMGEIVQEECTRCKGSGMQPRLEDSWFPKD